MCGGPVHPGTLIFDDGESYDFEKYHLHLGYNAFATNFNEHTSLMFIKGMVIVMWSNGVTSQMFLILTYIFVPMFFKQQCGNFASKLFYIYLYILFAFQNTSPGECCAAKYHYYLHHNFQI